MTAQTSVPPGEKEYCSGEAAGVCPRVKTLQAEVRGRRPEVKRQGFWPTLPFYLNSTLHR